MANLGLSEENTMTLEKNVSVVFHVAATIKLTESLKLALEMNLLGTIRIVQLCKRMEKLAVSIFS